MTAPTHPNCTVCKDSTPCERNGLLAKQVMGRSFRCVLERDEPGAGFVYKVLLRLADAQGINVSELMSDEPRPQSTPN